MRSAMLFARHFFSMYFDYVHAPPFFRLFKCHFRFLYGAILMRALSRHFSRVISFFFDAFFTPVISPRRLFDASRRLTRSFPVLSIGFFLSRIFAQRHYAISRRLPTANACMQKILICTNYRYVWQKRANE